MSAYEACLAERKRIAAEASRITDLQARGRRYQSMPECRPDAAATPVPASMPAQPPAASPPLAVVPARPIDIPEIKSPSTALALSLGSTALGYGLLIAGVEYDNPVAARVGSLIGLIGPTTGHIYANNFWNTGLKYRLLGMGGAFGGLLIALSACPPFGGSCDDSTANVGFAVAVAGSVVYLGGAIYEISTAPRAAREYNLKRAGYQLVPIANANIGGAALVGTF